MTAFVYEIEIPEVSGMHPPPSMEILEEYKATRKYSKYIKLINWLDENAKGWYFMHDFLLNGRKVETAIVFPDRNSAMFFKLTN